MALWKKAIAVVAVGVGSWVIGEEALHYLTSPPAWYKREKIVILGTGWAALSIVQEVDPRFYDITIISPRNFFLFTPLLPSTTVGTIETRSIIEPIRGFLARTKHDHSNYLEAMAVDVDLENKTVMCEGYPSARFRQQAPEVNEKFSVPYDKLVVAVGAVNNTFGVPGVKEHCSFLKELPDARRIRASIVDAFERANYPGRTSDEVSKLLHFVVVGGGPTGVEFAAELHDLIRDDLSRQYPNLTRKVTITLVESLDHVLNTFSKAISEYAEKLFKRQAIDVQTRARVTEVAADHITVFRENTKDTVAIPCGLCVWSTGIGANPFVQKLLTKIPGQTNRRALTTDEWLRVKGADGVYAAGDCSTVEQRRLNAESLNLFKEGDVDNDGTLSRQEFEALAEKLKKRYPAFRDYGEKVEAMWEELHLQGKITLNEFQKILQAVDSHLKSFPPTAQVANQQGQYLGEVFNIDAYAKVASVKAEVPSFRYKHFGSFAYVGGESAVAEFPAGYASTGFFTWFLWRSAYLSKLVSMRNKLSVAFDW
eukprot:CAMPEP_0184663318 /NCGR_PEP_ID=MMETSP0308-20130426/47671_1 /TAXON_ID=38269 /ORGANISM="Gloeochaete witrockiana, Strain SAG 46.84" /LENGTH=537 /DNA_ID=CAMNT_0027105983 /DNA_START=378 /DNA_END=1988 /DNA_ORIENTATION=+